MSFLKPKTPRPREVPIAPKRTESRAAANEDEQRRQASRGPSLRAATLLGRAGPPRQNTASNITSILGSQSV